MAQFKAVTQNFPRKAEKIKKNLSHNSWHPIQVANQTPPKYKS